MKRILALFCVVSGMGLATAPVQTMAQTVQRPYGTGYGTGYGTTGSALGGAASPYGGTPNGIGANTPYGATANSATKFTGGNTGTNSAAPTASATSPDYNRVMNSVDSTTDNATGDNTGDGTQPALAVPPNASGSASSNGYARPLGGNGMLTSPGGTTGLGAYNQSPYATGGVTGPSGGTAAPGPATPVYSGTKE